MASAGEAISRDELEKVVAETVAKSLPLALSVMLASGGLTPLSAVTPRQEVAPPPADDRSVRTNFIPLRPRQTSPLT